MNQKREECIQHIYQGKVIDVWLGWLVGYHENYVLGKSEKDVRNQLKNLIRVDFNHSIDGSKIIATSPDHSGIEAEATSTREAEAELIYKINLTRGIIDYKIIAMELVLGMTISSEERAIIEKEIMELSK